MHIEGRRKLLLQQIHSGMSGHHVASRTLVSKAFRASFYWPTAGADASMLVQCCPGCQVFAKQSHMPLTALRTVPITWPFAVWGLDMVGPLKEGTHKNKYLLVMVDKFAESIEEKLVTSVKVVQVIWFISEVVHRFTIPHSLIFDNGTNFMAKEVKSWCKKMGIKLDYASVYHP